MQSKHLKQGNFINLWPQGECFRDTNVSLFLKSYIIYLSLNVGYGSLEIFVLICHVKSLQHGIIKISTNTQQLKQKKHD